MCEQRGAYFKQEANTSYAALIWCFGLFGLLADGLFKGTCTLKNLEPVSPLVSPSFEKLQRKPNRNMAIEQVTQKDGNHTRGLFYFMLCYLGERVLQILSSMVETVSLA